MPHTPGPWSYWGGDTSSFEVYQDSTEQSICELSDHQEQNVEHANAKLISAAPDLLAACKDAAILAADARDEEDERVYKVLIAAINKAQGKATK